MSVVSDNPDSTPIKFSLRFIIITNVFCFIAGYGVRYLSEY